MKEFYIDFASYTVVEAGSKEQAVSKFWKWIEELQDKNIIAVEVDIIGTVEIDGVEEREV